jgi:drug/metabolite transporter (DMT)-like permease
MAGSRQLGIVLVLAACVPFALSGVFTKLITADIWSVLAWRGVFGGAMTLAYATWRGRQGSFGAPGWLLVAVGTAASIAFLGAFRLTYVANVVLIYALTPFAAAGLGWLVLRERVRPAVLGTAAVSLVGVAVIMWGGLGAPQLLGDGVAFAMMLLSALFLVLARRFRGTDMMQVGVVSSALLFPVAVALGEPFAMSAPDLWWSVAFGAGYAAGYILWMEGVRRIPAAESGVLALAETPVAIVLAWALLNELPPTATSLGGMVVMAAVLHRALADWRAEARQGVAAGTG